VEITWRLSPGEPAPLPATHEEAVFTLQRGNRVFADLRRAGSYVIPVSAEELGFGGGHPQTPIAAVLGCADARVPLELVFSQPANDLFVVRVAGNVLGDATLGSLDFAVERLESVRVLAVVGHTGCGALTSAVDAYVTPHHYLALSANLPLRGIVDGLLPSVRAADAALRGHFGADVVERDGFRAALIDASVVVNAALTAEALTRLFAARLGDTLGVVFGVYDLNSRLVGVPDLHSDWRQGLVTPPGREDIDGFVLDIVRSLHVRDLLGQAT
jgi:carbonic anhydrase